MKDLQKLATSITEAALLRDLEYRARTTPAAVVEAPDVTLVCVDCVHPQLAACALDLSRRGLRPARTVLISHERPDVMPAGVDWIQVPELSMPGYQRFCLQELWKHVPTSHCLTIESDGWIIRPERFRKDWLQYDYVGAPWPMADYSAKSRVGNSGCCLRSRRLLESTAAIATPERIRRHHSFDLLVDTFTCFDLWDDLARLEMRFAPAEVAADFAFEQPTEYSQDLSRVFGYHGLKQTPTQFIRREVKLWTSRTAWRQAGNRLRVLWNQYDVDDQARRAELHACRAALEENPHIDDLLIYRGRPTFGELIETLNYDTGPHDVNVMLNSDCHLDYTAADFASCRHGEFWALARRDPRGPHWRLWNVPYAQDCWAWRGRCELSCDVLPGTVGCDNVLAYRALAAGYQVKNPSRSIRVCHHHAGESRSQLTRVPPPYLFIWPHTLADDPEAEIVSEFDGPPGPAVRRD